MDLLEKGVKAEDKFDYNAAVEIYHRILEEYPGTPAAEDAQLCIDLLKKEGKIEVDSKASEFF